ncbi:MAG: BspA family leucine-rich repeat surface protein [Roseburia faecis]|nr:BspA family leucine-rich repeat surface protein [Roseburia faecis]
MFLCLFLPCAGLKAKAADTSSTYTITYEAGDNGRFPNGTTENKVTYTHTHHDTSITKYSHTANIDDTGAANGTYASNLSTTDTVTIPGAAKLTIDVWYSTESTNYDWLAIYPAGVTPSNSNYSSASISGGKLGDGRVTSKSEATRKQFTVNGDTAQFYFKSDGSANYYGYYATITDGYDSCDAASGAYKEPVPNDSKNLFNGWYTDNAYTTKINDPSSLKADTTVYAKISKYTIEGTWGTCPWGITKDGVLEIGAGTGAEQSSSASAGPWNTYASQIKSINFSGKVIAPSNCRYLFSGLSNAAKITNAGNFDTSNVTDMSHMFSGCHALTTLDASGWNTGNVTGMDCMFSGCNALTTLNVSGWDTGNVTDMSDMFFNCKALTSLDVSNWNTGKVTNMEGMFDGCYGLASLDVSKWNTGNVTDMSWMFHGCTFTTLDVNGWNTGNVTDMSWMFTSCLKLATIYVGSGWNTDKVTSSSGMFYGATSLVGGAGTKFNSSHVDKAYAHIDGGTSNPGYLTSK